MHRNRRTTVIVAGGALAIASVGYGLGTQAGDGTAVAGNGGDRTGGPGLMFECGAPPGFSGLADNLGVEPSALTQALRDFHEQERADRRDDFASALARALDIPVEKVTAALDELHAKVEERVAKRRDALLEAAPAPAPPGVSRHFLPVRQLASALDVSRAELRKAFRELRPDREDAFKEHTEALAGFLAERFDLDVDEVSDALADLPRPAPPPRGVRPGPGGPGAFGLPL